METGFLILAFSTLLLAAVGVAVRAQRGTKAELPPGPARMRRAFFTLAFFVFTCAFPYIGAINNPNENVRLYMTMALVDGHTFRIDEIVQRHGWTNDMARAPDKKTGEFHLYSVKAPAVSYAGVPVYWAFTKLAPRFGHPVPTTTSTPPEREWWLSASTLVLRLFTIQLPCFVFLLWFERWLCIMTDDPVLRLSAVAAAGLGSNYLAYSLMFASHALFAVAAFVSFGITTRERFRHFAHPRRRSTRAAFWAGFFAGLATLLEYHALPVSMALALYAATTFYRPTRLVSFGAGGVIHVAMLMLFQWRAFGDPLMPGHKMVENQAFAALHHQGFLGMSMPNLEVFRDISLSHSFGFFGTSPFMWLGLLAIPFGLVFARGPRAKRSTTRVAVLACVLIMVLLWGTVSAAIIWRGGWTIGPRYLGAAPPFFAFAAATALEGFAGPSRWRRAIARGLSAGLALASVGAIGLVGLHLNTLPESVTRPLSQFTLPMLRAGFVPHHVGELFHAMSPWFFYAIVGCLVAAALVPALWPSRDRWWTWVGRVLLAGAAAAMGLVPAFSKPEATEGGDGVGVKGWVAAMWEPRGRDRITTLREQAERFGPRRPCLWYTVADLERSIDMTAEATRDEKHAGGVDRARCR